jgi:hypothetical protein
MNQLYPIIRRIRRPLIVEEPAPVKAGGGSVGRGLGQDKGAGPAKPDPVPEPARNAKGVPARNAKGVLNAKGEPRR